jgi:hypothetical protein
MYHKKESNHIMSSEVKTVVIESSEPVVEPAVIESVEVTGSSDVKPDSCVLTETPVLVEREDQPDVSDDKEHVPEVDSEVEEKVDPKVEEKSRSMNLNAIFKMAKSLSAPPVEEKKKRSNQDRLDSLFNTAMSAIKTISPPPKPRDSKDERFHHMIDRLEDVMDRLLQSEAFDRAPRNRVNLSSDSTRKSDAKVVNINFYI